MDEKIMEKRMPKKTIDEEFEIAHNVGKINDEDYERIEEIHLDVEREEAKKAILDEIK